MDVEQRGQAPDGRTTILKIRYYNIQRTTSAGPPIIRATAALPGSEITCGSKPRAGCPRPRAR